jgi:hypothetical protein
MGKRATPPSDSEGPIEPVDLREALEQRYLAYALSTIMHRALPDVRDGLKPVHRRLLYAMQQLRLSPQGEFRKCAKIVGDTMGNFHPHGNQAIYDALARLAQDFTVRYPLVDGQGNFGNIDGDNPAAERYTEARLTEVSARLLDGIDEDTVDFRANYDGRELEPSVLPANFPNLLANGASGIAVGMATNIPPHNAGELCDAALHLIKFPNATADKLVELVPGPDLPTGGIIVEPREQIVEAYKTGRGSFRLRALDSGGYWARYLPDRRHRDPLSDPEGPARRPHRRAVANQEAATPRRHSRRVDRSGEARARAEEPHRRSYPAHGIDVQAHRARDARPAQHECVEPLPSPERPWPAPSVARMARPPPGRAGSPLEIPARQDRPPARSTRWLSDRLPQHRQGHQNHPR